MTPPLELRRRPKPFRDARRFIVAVEGQETEPWYFEGLLDHEVANPRRVQIEVLPTDDGKSSPAAVVQRLQQHMDAEGTSLVAGLDESWVVIDRDRWPGKAINALLEDVKNAGWRACVSDPCFEVWLILHFEPPTCQSSSDAKAAWGEVRAACAHPKWPFTRAHVRAAVDRSSATDTASAWPQARPSTQVHRLVDALVPA